MWWATVVYHFIRKANIICAGFVNTVGNESNIVDMAVRVSGCNGRSV